MCIIDDEFRARRRIAELLSQEDGYEVVGEADNGADAVELIDRVKPDLIFLDIRMPGKNGIEACREIKERFPDVHVLMLTSYAEDEMLFDAISAGAAGYVLKQGGGEELVRAVRRVAEGDALLDPAVTQRVLARVREATRREQAAAFRDLTEQELRVLGLVSEGLTNKEIAKELFLGEGTVRNYVSSILSKLDLTNRAEAAAYAVRHALHEFLDEIG